MTIEQTKPKRTISLEELSKQNPSTEEISSSTEDRSVSKISTNEMKLIKKDNRFYLPILRLNDQSSWESKPIKDRIHLTDKVATETCLSNCNGYIGVKSSCCRLDPDNLEHVLGPIDESWIKRTIRWYHKKGMVAVTRQDLVIDFDEGKIIGETFFNSHPVFMKSDTYPILRIQADGPRFACKNLNTQTGKCTIYSIRPDMCQKYYCQYLKTNFLINLKHSPSHPGEWIAVDLKIERKDSESETDPDGTK